MWKNPQILQGGFQEMKQKIISFITVVTMVISLLSGFPITVNAAEDDLGGGKGTKEKPYSVKETYSFEGSGTVDEPYKIPNLEALTALREAVNSGEAYEDKYFLQTADIDMGAAYREGVESWAPIGLYTSTDNNKPFKGHYDGGSHKIENIYINKPSESYQGLFGYVDGGTIKNVTVSGNVTAYKYVGLVCGQNKNSSIENCDTEEGSVVRSTDKTQASVLVGGICGRVYTSKPGVAYITDCTNKAIVEGTGSVGGIFGSSSGGIISGCTNWGSVTVSSNESQGAGNTGGIGGVEASLNGKVAHCYNAGSVSGTYTIYTGTGGILGSTVGTIEDCYNDGGVSGYQQVGGICGANNQLYTGGAILRCYNTGDISGQSDVGGICGDAGNIKDNVMTIADCFNTGKVSGKFDTTGGVCGAITVFETEPYGNYSGGVKVIRCYSIGYIDNGETDETSEMYDKHHSNVCGNFIYGVNKDNVLNEDLIQELSKKRTIDNCFYQVREDVEAPLEGCEPKKEEQFAFGEVAYLLRSAQKQAGEENMGTEKLVWGQKLYGSDKDNYPVLSSDEEKEPFKVQFMAFDSQETPQELCIRYTNPGQKVSLPAAPSSVVYKFMKWSTSQDEFDDVSYDFTDNTPVTKDGMKVYAIGEEMYGESDGGHTLETVYGTAAELDLSTCVKFAQTEETADKFTYTIESGNDMLGASINGDILTVPDTVSANEGYTLTIKAHKRSQEIALMPLNSLDTEDFTFDVKIIVKKATPTVTPPKANRLTYTGAAQELITAGNTTGGELQYSLDNIQYSAAVPMAEYAGTYTVYYKVAGDANYEDVAEKSVEAIITVSEPAHTHSYGTEWKSDSGSHWHECVCGEKSGAAAHTEDGGSVTKAQTETETGIRIYKCSVCGYVMRTEVIEKLPPTKQPEETVKQEEIKKNSEKLDSGISADFNGNKFTLSWENVDGAQGYDIFVAQCGKKLNKKSLIKTVKGKKTSISLAKIAGRKISGKKTYKAQIKAWRYVDGKKVYVGSSRSYHVAGNANKKYTNVKKLKPAKKKYSLKKGKSTRIQATVVRQSKKKKLLPKSHGPALRYQSSDEKIAKVTQGGKVTAKKKGTCYITVAALNGINTRIKITVK